jgi:hypothetical protein
VTAPSGSAVYISTTGQLGTVSSSMKYKKNIEDIDINIVNNLYNMKVKSFQYLSETNDDPVSYGMIAEEMENVDAGLVVYKDGQPETIKYHLLVPLLVGYIQKLQDEIDEINRKLA